MSRIKALDEITARLGTPVFLRWIDAPFDATAAVVRFRHRGAVVDLSASGTFRLIYQLSPSQVMRDGAEPARSHDTVRAGSIITSFLQEPERIRILGSADTLHLFFSSEFSVGRERELAQRSPRFVRDVQAMAAQVLVSSCTNGADGQLQQVVASLAKLIAAGQDDTQPAAGGLASRGRHAMLRLLEQRLVAGVSVPELAQAAHLSLHHFIKVCRQSEGLTPHALLLQKRIERSVELILTQKAPVEEIALEVGFSSPSHFVSTFRRLIGVTPASLRRAARS